MTAGTSSIRIVRAAGDTLYDEDGREYVDLFTANGTAWLGHRPASVEAAIQRQLTEVWTTGALETPAAEAARKSLTAWMPARHRVAGLYSTGMEAAEFALRFARTVTGRHGAVGFAQGMHGKSLATSALTWKNPHSPAIADFTRIPFLPDADEPQILERLAETLARGAAAAVFVEPWHASGGGHRASDHFFREVRRLCRESATLLVFDELLTGFYRTGPRFFFEPLGFTPDLLLLGKSLGSGFPVSAVVHDGCWSVSAEMLPGSTFAGNSLAATAVTASLAAMQTADLPTRVPVIEQLVRNRLAGLSQTRAAVRGRGALWVIELPRSVEMPRLAAEIYRRGVAVGYAGRMLRLLPPATIDPGRLTGAVNVVAECVARACGSSSS